MVKYRDTGNNRTAQTSWLAFANFISLISALIISAVLSRFMTPAEYGTYCQVNYVYSTLLVLFSFGLPGAYSYFLARVPVEEGRDVVRKLNLLFFRSFVFFFNRVVFRFRYDSGIAWQCPSCRQFEIFRRNPHVAYACYRCG